MQANAKLAGRWVTEIESAEKWQKTYLARCKKIIRRYRNEQKLVSADVEGDDNKRFAILWSNIQTLGPAVYARTPDCVVTRRYRDSDPVGRYASEVLERAVNYSNECDDLAATMKLCRDDYLLIARGQAWVRFVPHVAASMQEAQEGDLQITDDAEDKGAEAEQQVYAECVVDQVAYDDFLFTPCRKWTEAWWVARRVFMDRAELIERFGRDVGGAVQCDWEPPADSADSEEIKAQSKKAAVYEVWDKRAGEVLWISKTYKAGPLDHRPDWLSLEGFFPCPPPLMGTTPQDKFIPVPDYVYYQDQAEELDDLTKKIGTLIYAIKVSGFYAGNANVDLQNLFQQGENKLIPLNAFDVFQEKGGVKGIIEWFPIEPVILALKTAFETRQKILEDIYQITGISDIVRGATDPRETAAAQGIKAQWGSLRVRDRQEELARFARDVMRIKAEIVAKKFAPATLAAMTDVQLPTQAQKLWAMQAQALQQQAQAAQQAGQPAPPMPPTPEGMPSPEVLSRPSWEEVDALLKNDALRSFRVEIETEATIQVDENEEKQRRVEFITALSQLIGTTLPALQDFPQGAPLIGKAVEFLARGFRVGREMEDVIEKTFEQVAQLPPQQPQGAPQGADPRELALEEKRLQLEAHQSQQQDQIDRGNQQLEAQGQQMDFVAGQQDRQLRLVEINQQQAAQGMRPPFVGGR